MKDLSIIIINYNTFNLTSACIQSIYQFTTGISFEIILVDNASHETNPDKFMELFPDVILVKSQRNVGFAKGNNLGIAAAQGNVLLLLNSDTQLKSNAIGNAFNVLINLPDTGVITTKLVFPDGTLQYQCGRFPSIKLQLIELFRLQKLMPRRMREDLLLGGFFDHQRNLYPDWIWGTFFMFKHEVLSIFPNNLLPETYFMYQEDLEWCYGLRNSAYRIFYYADEVVIHLFAGSSVNVNQNKQREYLLRNNLNHFIKKNYGYIYFFVFRLLQQANMILQRK